MTNSTLDPISINDALANVTFLANRTPLSSGPELMAAFSQLTEYRDGSIYVGHYAGSSDWERHVSGDEIVLVLSGETTLIILENEQEVEYQLTEKQLLIVPKNTWHRFITPQAVQIMTVTPQPTDHSVELPVSLPQNQRPPDE